MIDGWVPLTKAPATGGLCGFTGSCCWSQRPLGYQNDPRNTPKVGKDLEIEVFLWSFEAIDPKDLENLKTLTPEMDQPESFTSCIDARCQAMVDFGHDERHQKMAIENPDWKMVKNQMMKSDGNSHKIHICRNNGAFPLRRRYPRVSSEHSRQWPWPHALGARLRTRHPGLAISMDTYGYYR